ncbi:MAG: LicD family protein [Actinomycetaceae bacterium]|nr:LicD family protein [Actinomycetaceae bacterium]MDO5747033.1 LicD family protein [Actinomycetaceae bacterium]
MALTSKDVSANNQMERCKQLQLFIADHVFSFCKQHNIDVHLAYGSLLGAIRHKGFIPWDDDIDLAMLRKDYQRFLALYSAQDTAPYCLQAFATDPKCPYIFAKVCLDGTHFPLQDGTDPGISIDIFPMDCLPNNKKRLRKGTRRTRLWRQLFISSQLWKAGGQQAGLSARIYSFIRFSLHLALFPIARRVLYKKFVDACRYLRHGECTTVTCLEGSPEHQYKKEWFAKTVLLPFEDRHYPCPTNWDAWLKTRYGNYHELPPEDQRYGHKPLHIDVGPWEHSDPPAY